MSWISNESDPGGGVRSLAQPGGWLATVHAAKGLEFTAVILCALDLLPNRKQADEVRDSNLLYVGLTRATDELIVTWAGRSAFTDHLPFASKAVAIDRRFGVTPFRNVSEKPFAPCWPCTFRSALAAGKHDSG